MLKVRRPAATTVAAGARDRARRGGRLQVRGADAAERSPTPACIGFFAWQRYSPIVPEGFYEQINVEPERDRHRAVSAWSASTRYDRVEYVANQSFWKTGQPYMDAITLKMHDRRAGPHRRPAGRGDRRRDPLGRRRPVAARTTATCTVLSGLNAAFRELQMTLKPGRERAVGTTCASGSAVNFAINRQQIINTRLQRRRRQYSGHVPPGYGPWPLTPTRS